MFSRSKKKMQGRKTSISARSMDIVMHEDNEDILGFMLTSDPDDRGDLTCMVIGMHLSQVKVLVQNLNEHLKSHETIEN